MSEEAIFKLHEDLSNLGPGDNQITLDILKSLPPLNNEALVLDLGCGTGRQTIVLAQNLPCNIKAVDLYQPYLDTLINRAEKAGVKHKIEIFCGDMLKPNIAKESVDLIWSEGAVFAVGFVNALENWRKLLKPSGMIVISEAVWLTDNPPLEAKEYWQESYPAMTNVKGLEAAANQAGYIVKQTRILPQQAWENYYQEMGNRIIEIQKNEIQDQELEECIKQTMKEIDIYQKHIGTYGYTFIILQIKNI